jgi:xanthine dehydrogenase YagT iron-sulfur-binding subunit
MNFSISLTVNGEPRNVEFEDPRVTLLDLLRERLDLPGTKKGCDRGQCGACTVLLDGRRINSCLALALSIDGGEVVTIEGLADGDTLHPVQQAFVEHDAMQCGFCTPGMVMSCAALVDRNPHCTLDDVKAAVSGHLCRCGTYPNVFKATLAAAERVRSGAKREAGAR